ncbi:MAG: lipoxygenase family protein [Polyangiales bacterium]|nr:hypothetical protein [Myxococcales bacterium]MCB9660183.1 hypothetical protein [Sandaracinaceae bacterium]
MVLPTLPDDDPAPARRLAALAAARETYRFDYSFENLPFAAEVPVQDQFSLEVLAKVTELKLQSGLNQALAELRMRATDGASAVTTYGLDTFRALVPESARGAVYDVAERVCPSVVQLTRELTHELTAPSDLPDSKRWPLTLEDYHRLFVTTAEPAVAKVWAEDWFFAYQRLAGCNPVVIRRASLADLGERFPVDDAFLDRALRWFGAPPTTLQKLADDGQLFLTDYSILEGVPAGTWDSGRRRKYLWAPLGLFAWLPAHGSREAGLMPIAVQCYQQHDPVEAPVFGPFDGVKWQMAKMVLQVADTHDHGIVRHLGLCHIIMESVTLCLFRNLAPAHPLRVLLEPHVAYTLATNEITQDSTINPGGVTVTLQSNNFTGTFIVLHRALDAFDWDSESPDKRYQKLGLADTRALPVHPFRDDELSCWAAILEFAQAYVDHYYASDEAVRTDRELQAFVAELGAEDGGRVRGVPEVHTRQQAGRFVANVIERATTYHNAINYSVFPYMGFVAGMPLAAYAVAPTARPATHAEFLDMLPPLHKALGQMGDYWTISGLLVNRLGYYGANYFADPFARDLAERFREQLAAIDREIAERNTQRPFPYDQVTPSRTAQSITV